MNLTTNDSAIAYWQATGYTQADIDSVCSQLENYIALRVNFLPGRSIHVTVSQRLNKVRQGHFPSVVDFIEKILQRWTYDFEPLGSLIFFLDDGMWLGPHQFSQQAPIFAYGRNILDPCTMLIPDPVFLESNGYQDELEKIESVTMHTNWWQRHDSVYWRGATSGINFSSADWQMSGRFQLTNASKQINDLNRCNAYFSNVIGFEDNPEESPVGELGLVSKPVAFLDMFSHRYLVDVDGEVNAWSGYLKLASDTTILKIHSSNRLWYYDLIKPWIHYVPAVPTVPSIVAAVDWMKSHPNECRAIASNARELIKSITYQRSFDYAAECIAKVLKCFRPE